MGYAIIQTGGKQYQVEPGRFYDVELLHQEPEDKLAITEVLLVNLDGTIVVGQPHVPNAVVDATVMKHYKAKKVIVYKMKPKKKTRKKNGHRQQLTRIMIDTIRIGGEQTTTAAETATTESTVE
ncbi:MAG: 50S ribosomal protein L21 [Cyanobacteria bacterium M5B4]|nr:50S ribosomal protein L21 [Cyanobacteria bacterium KgW148]PLS68985.1 MAG: 50S ribosomal protein L21 [Cyanobacteria bacterium M5B4]